ncbi:MAG: hypothetical protein ACLTTW_04910 [Coprobacter sp.]
MEISLNDKMDGAFVDIITRNKTLLQRYWNSKENEWNENLTLKLISDSRVCK